ncbi:MAG: glutamate--cysteine ligase [Alphaproteobacteria bacterium]|nr:MAG: glutamate--cysteine ligase [Alphaproteobacteria bacterium]
MGEEIARTRFSREDFREFQRRLKAETELLRQWLEDGRFAAEEPVAGAELEAWLTTPQGMPAARNLSFLERAADLDVLPELSQFNVEFNVDPVPLRGKALSRLERELMDNWQKAGGIAEDLDIRLLMIGILPTITEQDMTLENLSMMKRYRALNQEIMALRKGRALTLDISGREHLRTLHRDIMLEAATTSFQMHLQIDAANSARWYNASKIASAPLVAVAANSPFLFGRDLWAETRIPLFEQAVSVGKWDYMERVTFGIRYLEEGAYEIFKANRQRYPVILPMLFDAPVEELRHLRLHNGTIWRWNRLLVGFSDDGRPHLRIEQRVVPAGPTIVDGIANAAFYYGLVKALAEEPQDLEERLPFHVARDNFYSAARDGLEATIEWADETVWPLVRAFEEFLLPMAERGLEQLGIATRDRTRYLGIIARRAATRRNGASWQREWVARHGRDMEALVRAYRECQESGEPVHEWPT